MSTNEKTLKHRGYIGSIDTSLEDKCLVGQVLFIKDKIIYMGETVDELIHAFEEAVDDYLDFCAEIGKKPEISCSGTFNVRISSELHYECVKQAYHRNITLNSYVALAIESQTRSDKKTTELSHKLNTLNERLLRITSEIKYDFSTKSIPVMYEEKSSYSFISNVYEAYGRAC